MTEPREPTDQLCIGATDMTDNTQPEALRLADALEYCDASVARQAINELRRQHARIAELEAQLSAIGAGGVSGPLMGKPQEMPDLSALTERGAKAWAGVDAQGLREGAASAGSEPVAWQYRSMPDVGGVWFECSKERADQRAAHPERWEVRPLYTHPSPPEGMVGGWIALPGALPEPGVPVLLDIGKKYPIRAMWSAKHTVEAADDDTDWGEYDEATDTYYCPEGWYEWNECEETHWAVSATPRAWAPLPPTSSADSGKGE